MAEINNGNSDEAFNNILGVVLLIIVSSVLILSRISSSPPEYQFTDETGQMIELIDYNRTMYGDWFTGGSDLIISPKMLKELDCADACETYRESPCMINKVGSGTPFDVCMRNCMKNGNNSIS